MRGIATTFAVATLTLAACTGGGPAPTPRSYALTDVGSPPRYPNGPYGFGVGNTIPNLVFQGKPGAGSGQSDLSLRPISLSDYQRHGTQKAKVLVIISCAMWCMPCQQEQPGLNNLYEQYQQTNPGEVVFLTSMVQDGSFHAATERALDSWSGRYQIPYDLVLDPTGSTMQTMDPAEQAGFPTVLVVRTRNMRITARTIGGAGTIRAIDAILANANDPNSPPPAPVGTIYPGPQPQPDCRLPGACGDTPPASNCPPGFTADVRCNETDDPMVCGWTVGPCMPVVTGTCPDASCGPKPDLPPDLCGGGETFNLMCMQLSGEICMWGGSCGPSQPPPPPSDCNAPGACGPPPPPSACDDGFPANYSCQPSPSGSCWWTSDCMGPPPPGVDCSLDGACGTSPAPLTCPNGSPPIVQCLDMGGFCDWTDPCPPPPPPRVDCTGQCPLPAPTDPCKDSTLTSQWVCDDYGSGCEWSQICSGGGGGK